MALEKSTKTLILLHEILQISLMALGPSHLHV